MKVFMLMTGNGPLVILTSHESIEDPHMLEKLLAKGIDKFIAYEIPYKLAQERYGGHFTVVVNDLRVLDYNGGRAFRLFHFSEMGKVLTHEPGMSKQQAA
ncbi:MAG: hypothetical protein GY814_12465 [Gammaproteobacteria bacterium]|nr:hypothetical protein [Gammaproteobacteria bacterium]